MIEPEEFERQLQVVTDMIGVLAGQPVEDAETALQETQRPFVLLGIPQPTLATWTTGHGATSLRLTKRAIEVAGLPTEVALLGALSSLMEVGFVVGALWQRERSLAAALED